jgi:hypothetical protein
MPDLLALAPERRWRRGIVTTVHYMIVEKLGMPPDRRHPQAEPQECASGAGVDDAGVLLGLLQPQQDRSRLL